MKKIMFLALIGLLALAGCQQPTPEKTVANLKDGIIGETTASAKYAAFAQKAREEGYDTIAKLFMAASKSEAIHADNHTKVLEKLGMTMDNFSPEFEVKTTEENLMAAIEGESYEVTTMYVQFIADADAEKVEKATKSFTWASDTEKKHQEFYTRALEALRTNQEKNLPFGFAVCPVCGNTYDNTLVDEKCAFCQSGKEKFYII